MKKLLLITSAALIGLASQATAALTVTDVGPTDLATELRELSKTDWAVAVATGKLKTSAGQFSSNNEIDDGPFLITKETPLTVESLYTEAVLRNDFGMMTIKPEFTPVVTNVDLKGSKQISSDSTDKTELGFAVYKKGGLVPLATATTSINDHVWTQTIDGKLDNPLYYLWFLEDSPATEKLRDFNDFIVLGTVGSPISAIPEPSTIISLIAVGFLGLVTWRNRRKVKA